MNWIDFTSWLVMFSETVKTLETNILQLRKPMADNQGLQLARLLLRAEELQTKQAFSSKGRTSKN